MNAVVAMGVVGRSEAAMSARSGRRPAVVCILWLAAISAATADEGLAKLVRALDSDLAAVRQDAGDKLLAARSAAIRPLIDGMGNCSPDAAWRAVAILEQLA